jgi:hypothetical protein
VSNLEARRDGMRGAHHSRGAHTALVRRPALRRSRTRLAHAASLPPMTASRRSLWAARLCPITKRVALPGSHLTSTGCSAAPTRDSRQGAHPWHISSGSEGGTRGPHGD